MKHTKHCLKLCEDGYVHPDARLMDLMAEVVLNAYLNNIV